MTIPVSTSALPIELATIGNMSRRAISALQAASVPSLVVDSAIIVAFSIVTGATFQFIARGTFGDILEFTATGAIVAIIYCGMIRLQAAHDFRAESTRLMRARVAFSAWVVTFTILAVVAFAFKIGAQFSRGAIFSFFSIGLLGIVTSRVATPRLLARWTKTTAFRGLEIIVVAPLQSTGAARLLAELAYHGGTNVHLVEFNDKCTSQSWTDERRGLLQRVLDVAHAAGPGEIYVLNGQLLFKAIEELIDDLRLLPRTIFFVPDHPASRLLQHEVRRLGSILAVEMQKAPLSAIESAAKRTVDVIVAGTALVFLLPLLVLTAVAIKFDSAGPLLFRQTRLGYQGKCFQILKFRSMSVLEDGDQIQQASPDDQRVTRVGRWLRKTSLDELPQLWNVLHGEMSIVGPRPHAAAHDTLYSRLIENYEVRQHVKPGITGWAQVHGLRGETASLDSMVRRIEMDLWYASNCSLGLDVKILLKTVGAVVGQKNAF